MAGFTSANLSQPSVCIQTCAFKSTEIRFQWGIVNCAVAQWVGALRYKLEASGSIRDTVLDVIPTAALWPWGQLSLQQ